MRRHGREPISLAMCARGLRRVALSGSGLFGLLKFFLGAAVAMTSIGRWNSSFRAESNGLDGDLW